MANCHMTGCRWQFGAMQLVLNQTLVAPSPGSHSQWVQVWVWVLVRLRPHMSQFISLQVVVYGQVFQDDESDIGPDTGYTTPGRQTFAIAVS